jgi:hypothetical protein
MLSCTQAHDNDDDDDDDDNHHHDFNDYKYYDHDALYNSSVVDDSFTEKIFKIRWKR